MTSTDQRSWSTRSKKIGTSATPSELKIHTKFPLGRSFHTVFLFGHTPFHNEKIQHSNNYERLKRDTVGAILLQIGIVKIFRIVVNFMISLNFRRRFRGFRLRSDFQEKALLFWLTWLVLSLLDRYLFWNSCYILLLRGRAPRFLCQISALSGIAE